MQKGRPGGRPTLLFLHGDRNHHFRTVEEAHKGIFREHVRMKVRCAGRVGQIDRVRNHRGDALHAAARSGDFHFRRVHVVIGDGIAVLSFAEESDANRHGVHAPRLEMKTHFGGDGAHQADAAHHLDVAIANAVGTLAAGRVGHIDHYAGMNSVSHAAQGAGGAAEFEHDGTHRIGTDLQSVGEILVLQADNTGNGIASKASQLQILKAEYWTDNARLDVTGELRDRIRGDSLKAIASNNIKGDPEFGQTKRLTVEYRFGGVTMTNEFREGDTIVIPTE